MGIPIIATYQSKVPGGTPINTASLCENSDGQGPRQEDDEPLEPMDEVFRPPGVKRRPCDSHCGRRKRRETEDGERCLMTKGASLYGSEREDRAIGRLCEESNQKYF